MNSSVRSRTTNAPFSLSTLARVIFAAGVSSSGVATSPGEIAGYMLPVRTVYGRAPKASGPAIASATSAPAIPRIHTRTRMTSPRSLLRAYWF